MASGVIPQITAIMGPSAGGAVYSPALTDWIFMVEKTSYMFITGPEVIKAVTRETVSKEDLGGAMAHAAKSGVAHFAAPDDRACMAMIRELMSYLPQNNMEDPPRTACSDDPARRDEDLRDAVPADPNKPYDMRTIIRSNLDDQSLLRSPRTLGAQHRGGLRPPGGRAGGHRRQSAHPSWPAAWTSMPPSRAPASYASAMPSTSP